MDPTRFDAFTKTVSTARSRRTLLRTLGAALGAAGLAVRGGPALATKGGNSACAHFCATVFGADTPQAEQCTREAAHGGGLCYCTGGEAGAPCGTSTDCCSGHCGGVFGCCPTCPADCFCATLFVGGLTCTTGSGSGQPCDQFTPCTTPGEACVGGHCQATCTPLEAGAALGPTARCSPPWGQSFCGFADRIPCSFSQS